MDRLDLTNGQQLSAALRYREARLAVEREIWAAAREAGHPASDDEIELHVKGFEAGLAERLGIAGQKDG